MRSLIVLTMLSMVSTAAAAQQMDGVDPRVYLKTRAQQPNAIHDVWTAPVAVAARILAKGPSDAMLAPRSAYPAGADVDAMRAVEKRALVLAAVHAVAEKKPTNALSLLEGALASRDVVVRAEAAEQMGSLGDAAIGALIAAARDDDASVREAAVIGLGRVRTERGFAALAPFVRDAKDARTQVAAIRALGAMSSRWAWQAKGDVGGGERMRANATLLLDDVEREGAVANEAARTAIASVRKVWIR